MRLDKTAQTIVHEEIEKLIDETNHEYIENTKEFVDELIKLYLVKLEATDPKTTISNLTNTRNGMLAIIHACNSAITELERAVTPETRALCNTFAHHLRIIIVQADTHYAGCLN